MKPRRQLGRDAERRFPVRIRMAVPPTGLGVRLTQIQDWLDQNAGGDGWAMPPSGFRGVLNDAMELAPVADGGHTNILEIVPGKFG